MACCRRRGELDHVGALGAHDLARGHSWLDEPCDALLWCLFQEKLGVEVGHRGAYKRRRALMSLYVLILFRTSAVSVGIVRQTAELLLFVELDAGA